MNKYPFKNIIQIFLFIFLFEDIFTQTLYNYDFGTSVSSYVTPGSINILPPPIDGNAYIYIASTPNGGAQIKNPGIATFGSGSKLMLHSSASGGSGNKLSIWGFTGGTSSYTKFSVVLADSNGGSSPVSGIFYFCTGTGNSFQNNNGLSPGEVLTGIKWSISSTGTVSTKTIKAGNSWRDITLNPFYSGQSNVYTIEVFGNNSFISINYDYNFASFTLAPLKQDIYINGILCADDIEVSGNGLTQGSIINSFMFYVEENAICNLCAFIDNIFYQSSIPANTQTYIDYYSKPSGYLNYLSSWTSNSDGSGTDYPVNFSGGASGLGTMNFNLTNRTSGTIDNNWVLSGQNCKLNIGSGSSACTLIIPSAYSLNAAKVNISNSGLIENNNTSSTFGYLNVYSGGSYIHNINGGTIPAANWNTNSDCYITGIQNIKPLGLGQGFYNLIWNSSGQSQIINLVLPSGFSIAGNLTIQNTGGYSGNSVSGRTVQMISDSSRSAVVSGDLILNGGNLALSGGSGAMNLTVNGNILLSGNSELYLSQNGTANNTLTSIGNITIDEGSLITDNGSTTGNEIVFSKTGTQYFSNSGTISNVNYTINSGSTVVINNNINIDASRSFNLNGTIFFGNYILSGNGNFSLGSGGTIGIGSSGGISGISLTGNIQNSGTRIFSSEGNYFYNGSAPQITGDGLNPIVNNITFLNSFGVALSGNVAVNGLAFVDQGIVDIGNFSVIINPAASLTGYSASAYFKTSGSGFLKRSVNNTPVIFPIGNGLYTPVTLNNTGSADNFSVRVQNTLDNPAVNDHIVNKQWVIIEETTGGSIVNAELQWNQTDENVSFDRTASVYLGKWTGLNWEAYYNVSGVTGSGPYNITAGNLNTFGNLIIGNPGALPVEMMFFTSSVNENNAFLTWKTSSEINNAGFEIYRINAEGNDLWKKIGYVTGKGTTNNETDYQFTDKKLLSGKYKYKLKQIDNNGNYEYHYLNNTVEIGTPVKDALMQNFPNPFNPITSIEYHLSGTDYTSIIIYDVLGKQIAALVNEKKEPGFYSVNFNGSNLSSGIYFYRVTSGKFTEIKKMILVK